MKQITLKINLQQKYHVVRALAQAITDMHNTHLVFTERKEGLRLMQENYPVGIPTMRVCAGALVHDLQLLLGNKTRIVMNAELEALLEGAFAYADMMEGVFNTAVQKISGQPRLSSEHILHVRRNFHIPTEHNHGAHRYIGGNSRRSGKL